jgi:hypothetical protein
MIVTKSDILSIFGIFPLKSVGRFVVDIDSKNNIESKKSQASSSKQARKKNRKSKFGQHYARDFDRLKLWDLEKTYKIPPEFSVEQKPEKFLKFRAKMKYRLI